MTNKLAIVALLLVVAVTATVKPLWCNTGVVPSSEASHAGIISNGAVYVEGQYAGVRLNINNGSTVWSVSQDTGGQTPSAGGNDVFFTVSGSVVGVDANTGTAKWTVNPPAWSYIEWHSQRLPYINGMVINTFTIQNSHVQGIDVSQGSQAWLKNFSVRYISNAVGWNNLAFVSMVGSVAAINVNTGADVWTCTLGCCASPNARGVVAAAPQTQRIFFSGATHTQLNALDTVNQKCLWSVTLSSIFKNLAVSADESIVVVGALEGAIYAFDAATGKQLWKQANYGACVDTEWTQCQPVISNSGVVYYGATDTVVGLNVQTGALVTNFSVGSALATGFAVGNGILFVPMASQVCAYPEAQSGIQIKQCATSTCTSCKTVSVPSGCQSESGTTSVFRSCSDSGLEVASYASSDCKGTPVSTRNMFLNVCYPDAVSGSEELVSCPH